MTIEQNIKSAKSTNIRQIKAFDKITESDINSLENKGIIDKWKKNEDGSITLFSKNISGENLQSISKNFEVEHIEFGNNCLEITVKQR